MMASGMLGILKYGFGLLYFGGFACCGYAYLIKKTKPDLPMIGLFALLCVYLFWRLAPSRLFLNDDLSHWSVAARYLLETDLIPDTRTRLISFQSYPLGSAAFIYYICRSLGNDEGLWMFAHNLLYALMILPVFSNLHSRKSIFAPIFAATFMLLFKFARPIESLSIDWLLSCCALGASGAVLFYRRDLRRALLSALPGIIVCVYLKNSGLIFAACTACLLFGVSLRYSSRRRTAFRVFALTIAVAAGAFLLWTLHVKHSFPAGLESKHAISLNAYAQEASQKSLLLILSIGKQMVFTWLPPSGYQIFSALFFLLCLSATLLLRRRQPEQSALYTHALHALWGCIAVYAMWFAMLFAMYIFSMPAAEANHIAAFDRYDSAGLLYCVGLGVLTMFLLVSHIEIPPCPRARLSGVCIAAAMLAMFSLLHFNMDNLPLNHYYQDLTNRNMTLPYFRIAPQKLLNEYNPPRQDGRFLIYMGDAPNTRDLSLMGYSSKFELHSVSFSAILRQTGAHAAEKPYVCRTFSGTTLHETPFEILSENIDQCDALLVYKKDPAFEALLNEFLSTYTGNTPVYYAY